MQRMLDIFLSTLGLIFVSPILVPIIIILRFSGEGEIFYLQQRIGFNGNVFNIIKLATMLKNSENMGAGTLTLKNDPRVLPIGKFLRKSKINELPQLINIFLGDMSIVGPRPLVPEGESFYSEKESKQLRSVRPGVTGIGSLVLRDEESFYAHRSDAHEFYKQAISPYKASVEIWYIKNKSIYLDAKIIFLTALSIIIPTLKINYFFKSMPAMPQRLLNSRKH
jgi:lipopolysaccharide/colanic/teichoic acid biosynthesis glycosyltransferase